MNAPSKSYRLGYEAQNPFISIKEAYELSKEEHGYGLDRDEFIQGWRDAITDIDKTITNYERRMYQG